MVIGLPFIETGRIGSVFWVGGYTSFCPHYAAAAISASTVRIWVSTKYLGSTAAFSAKAAIYSSSSGLPASKLGESDELSFGDDEFTIPGYFDFTFSTPVNLTAGTLYHFAFLTSRSVFQFDNTYTTTSYGLKWDATTTYVGGFPATPTISGTLTPGSPYIAVIGGVTGEYHPHAFYLKLKANGGGTTWITIKEIEFHTSIGGSDVIDSIGAYTYVSAESAPYVVANIVDNGANVWASSGYAGGDGYFVAVEFNQDPGNIVEYKITGSPYANETPTEWDLYTWNGSAWVIIDQQAGLSWSADESKTFTIRNIRDNDSTTITESVVVEVVGTAVTDPDISIVDSISISESISSALSDPEVSIVDTCSISESVGCYISNDIDVSIFDSSTLAESVELFIPEYFINIYSDVSVAEFYTSNVAQPDISLVVYEIAMVREYVETAIISLVSVFDAVTVAEDVATPLIYLLVEINTTQDCTITEETTGLTSDLYLSVSDFMVVIAVKYAAVEVIRKPNTQDSVHLAELTVAQVSDLTGSAVDTVTLSEQAVVDFVLQVLTYENITTDSVVITTPPALPVSANDAVSVAENVIADNYFFSDISVIDSIAVAESVVMHQLVYVVAYDSVSIAEDVSNANAVLINSVQTVTIAEAVTVVSGTCIISVVDSVGAYEIVNADNGAVYGIIILDVDIIVPTVIVDIIAPVVNVDIFNPVTQY